MGVFGWIGAILGLVFTVAIIVIVILLVVFLIRRLNEGPRPYNPMSSAPAVPGQMPKDIAAARYARGEITREEYQKILADLNL